MKLALRKFFRAMAMPVAYLFCGALIGTVSILMSFNVMPFIVSLLITYLGFVEDAPATVIYLMGGIPCIFAAMLLAYGTIKFLGVSCRKILDWFRDLCESWSRKIDLESGGKL